MNLVLKRSITQFSQSAEEELTGQGMERLSFIEADENTPTERFVPKILSFAQELLKLIKGRAVLLPRPRHLNEVDGQRGTIDSSDLPEILLVVS